MNKSKNIIKDYYNLIESDKNKLIPYYFIYFLNIIIELIIPIYIAKITESLTNSLIIVALASIINYSILKILNNLLGYADKYIYQRFFRDNYITIYKKIVKKIYNFDEEHKKKISTGKIINSLTSDIVNIGEMADNFLKATLNILKSIVVIIYFFRINIFLALIIIGVDVIYIIRSNCLNNKSVKYLKEQKKENDQLIGLINQTLLGLKDIQTLNITNTMDDKYNYIYKDWKKAYDNRKKYERYRQNILKCFLIIIKSIVYFTCVYLMINNKITIGIILIIISYFDSLFSASENIMDASQSIKDQNISVNRIKEILEYNTIKEKNLKEIKNIKGIIEFKNIDFSYSNEKLLQNLNFIIRPNRITAITGTNGTGKTTIVDLILRLHSPTKGEILLDNINVKEIDKNSYLKEISVLNQESYLFNLSIRENFNLVENDIKKQEEMCKLTGIDKFIKTLPKGYDTIIDENSHNISGGQKRLLSLTRTLLKDAKILIFDEATSSLDTDKIQNVINVLNELKKNHTVIVITHKEEIENIADEVITINDGKVKIKTPRVSDIMVKNY
jgi:ATP-binding cassette subfamily B protein